MNQHFLVGPDAEEYRIFSSPDPRNSTVIGSDPVRKHEFQRKLVLHGGQLAESHCNIKPFSTSALVKSLTSSGVTGLNGTPIKVETVVTVKNGDVLQIGEEVYIYEIRSLPHRRPREKRVGPVTNPDRYKKPSITIDKYLRRFKKNPNYTPSLSNPRK